MSCIPRASGHGASTDAPAAHPTDCAITLRAAIERVVMSRTTIEIELAEGMASDDQNRVLIIPWTPPSPRRRREAVLCPALVKAAIDGRLPRGFGVKRLMDLPMAWPDQWSALGLRAPAER